jgi:hypothetical protein
MRIHVYAIAWNERRIIEFFLRHYEALAERIVVYDEDSDDGSREILGAREKVEVRRFVRSDPKSLELSKLAILNHCWKEARNVADWVIIVDIDEFVFHPRLTEYLSKQKRRRVTIIPTLGFQMISEQFPRHDENLASTRTMGSPHASYNKPCIFDPAAIAEMDLGVGSHQAIPIGRLKFPARDEVMLLHYKYLGPDYLADRYEQLASRRGTTDVENRWSTHFALPREQWRQVWSSELVKLVDISNPGFSPRSVHRQPPWRSWTALLRRLIRQRFVIAGRPQARR